MKLLKSILEDVIKLMFIGIVAITAVNLYDNFIHEEPAPLMIDIYARDNTVHTI